MILAAVLTLAAATAPPLRQGSQLVLQRYTERLTIAKDPQTLIFSYALSQVGPQDIDQTHRIYRSGSLVRDETLVVDGAALRSTRIARYRNRYTLHDLAPRETAYAFIFVRPVRTGSRYDYLFRAFPLGAAGAFVVQSMTIDGRSFLPREIRFTTLGVGARASGTVTLGPAGKYWVPQTIAVQGTVNGRSARERMTFYAYQFPASLPKSTFQSPKPLPPAFLPTF